MFFMQKFCVAVVTASKNFDQFFIMEFTSWHAGRLRVGHRHNYYYVVFLSEQSAAVDVVDDRMVSALSSANHATLLQRIESPEEWE
jgi:hypothetical protein